MIALRPQRVNAPLAKGKPPLALLRLGTLLQANSLSVEAGAGLDEMLDPSRSIRWGSNAPVNCGE